MKRNFLFMALSFLAPLLAFAQTDHPENLSPVEAVEVVWASHLDGSLDPVKFFTLESSLQDDDLDLRSRLRLLQIKSHFLGGRKSMLFRESLSETQALGLAAERRLYSNVTIRFGAQARKQLLEAKKRILSLDKFRPKTREEIEDLVFDSPPVNTYGDGSYQNGVKLFLFCRKDRSFPCRFVLKDAFDRLVRKEDQTLWTLSALAKSASNRPYYITNGHTPSGVHSIDSVMPKPDQQKLFGKFRRVILNWIPSDNEALKLLPESAAKRKWWKQASLARDNGRKWLRIHGTGRINRPGTSWYPHSPTNGCVSTKEGSYEGVEHRDQRFLLDALMGAMQMAPVYANESKIKGMLYVVELDDKKARVTDKTLKEYGIH